MGNWFDIYVYIVDKWWLVHNDMDLYSLDIGSAWISWDWPFGCWIFMYIHIIHSIIFHLMYIYILEIITIHKLGHPFFTNVYGTRFLVLHTVPCALRLNGLEWLGPLDAHQTSPRDVGPLAMWMMWRTQHWPPRYCAMFQSILLLEWGQFNGLAGFS